MIVSEFATALGEGATLVTPNNRLARHLVARYDDAQHAAGLRAWTAGRVLPWQGWLKQLWLEALATDAVSEPRVVISDIAAGHLWHRVIAQESPGLLDPRGAAVQAAEAWATYHAWRRPDDPFEGWSRAGIGDDAATFSWWAQRFSAALNELGLVHPAQLAGLLTDAAPQVAAWRGQHIVTVGFIEFTPQQRRLLAALSEAGAMVTTYGLPQVAMPSRHRVVCATPESELGHALAWARERALADPAASIGIVIEDLASRRAEVAARAEDILCPALASRVRPDASRPYDVSLGTPLADVPMIAAAIDLVAMGAGALPVSEAAALLRSAYLPDADTTWSQRSATERRWREQGVRWISLSDFMRALDRTDPVLAAQWRAATAPGNITRSPEQWASDWRAWLHALGWPGTRPLGSGEWQAGEAWSRLLAAFGSLRFVSPLLTREDALASLRNMASQTVFQPEAAPARIQILGVLEASGLEFDALWVAGMTAERWPPVAHPSALLPLAWQRERHVPHCDPAVDLRHARALTTGFAGAARDVIASHASQVDGFERAASALFEDWDQRELASLPVPEGLAVAIAAQRDALIPGDTDAAPPLPMNALVRGGVGIIESQSTCPFQAFARYRLRVDAWPAPSEGLTPRERGILLHAALAALWDSLRDHATLASLTDAELGARIASAVTRARTKLDRERWNTLPAAVASAESERLAQVVRAWLDAFEFARTPFTVRDTELSLPLTLGGIGLKLRIDRVDDLADGGIGVIDYKSGRAVAPVNWFAARPSGTQLGLYALALRAAPSPLPLRALVYAQLKAGEIDIKGLTADSAAWPTLTPLPQMRHAPIATWADLPDAWESSLGALALEFRKGIATVSPRDGEACKHCELQALCRIQSLDDPAVAADANDDD
ncbi:MAG: PD-(D/E)XK nuclease family protein [Betaproteobacteria bacterium]